MKLGCVRAVYTYIEVCSPVKTTILIHHAEMEGGQEAMETEGGRGKSERRGEERRGDRRRKSERDEI